MLVWLLLSCISATIPGRISMPLFSISAFIVKVRDVASAMAPTSVILPVNFLFNAEMLISASCPRATWCNSRSGINAETITFCISAITNRGVPAAMISPDSACLFNNIPVNAAYSLVSARFLFWSFCWSSACWNAKDAFAWSLSLTLPFLSILSSRSNSSRAALVCTSANCLAMV